MKFGAALFRFTYVPVERSGIFETGRKTYEEVR